MLDLFQPGAYCRAIGGNLQRPDIQSPVVKWMAWSINPDNGGGGSIQAWDTCRAMWNGAGILNFPWFHCRSMQDIDRLIQAAEQENSPAIGLNIEDVVTDKLPLQQVASLVQSAWSKPVHMATLGWVQNGQGWQHMDFAVVALEFFPGEGPFPKGWDPVVAQQCIDHALAEGLTQVTLMFGTKVAPSTYGSFFAYCHSLYTADDITPTPTAWDQWRAAVPCEKIEPPKPPEPPTPKPSLTPAQVPYTGPYSLPTGSHRARGPTALALKRAMKRSGYGFADKELKELDEHYNEALEAALDKWNAGKGWNGYGEKRWEAIRALIVPSGRPSAGQYALDGYAQDLIRDEAASKPPPVKVPDLGPLWSGGKSVLKMFPSHQTSGIPDYIAYDDAFSEGTSIIAPEDIEIFNKLTSSNPGKAFYAKGASKLQYWFGHLDRDHPLGTKFKKGAFVGKVAPNNVGGGPHVHLGIYTKALIGKNLKWGTNGNGPEYTYSKQSVGEQLEEALV